MIIQLPLSYIGDGAAQVKIPGTQGNFFQKIDILSVFFNDTIAGINGQGGDNTQIARLFLVL